MSIPVNFADITKPIKDLLTKDYPIGVTTLEVKTTAPNGVAFTVKGSKNNDSGLITGELKTDIKSLYQGTTLTQAWTTENALNTDLEVDNAIAKGLSTKFSSALFPAIGKKNALIKAVYKQEHLHTTSTVDLRNFTIAGDAVVSSGPVLLGGEFGYDVQNGSVTKYNFALGYSVSEWNATLHVSDALKVFTAAYFHRVNSGLEAGAKATYNAGKDKSAAVAIELGSKYALDSTSYAKVRINSDGVLGLSYTQLLRKGVKATVGSSINTARFNEASHKVGLALVLEN